MEVNRKVHIKDLTRFELENEYKNLKLKLHEERITYSISLTRYMYFYFFLGTIFATILWFCL